MGDVVVPVGGEPQGRRIRILPGEGGEGRRHTSHGPDAEGGFGNGRGAIRGGRRSAVVGTERAPDAPRELRFRARIAFVRILEGILLGGVFGIVRPRPQEEGERTVLREEGVAAGDHVRRGGRDAPRGERRVLPSREVESAQDGEEIGARPAADGPEGEPEGGGGQSGRGGQGRADRRDRIRRGREGGGEGGGVRTFGGRYGGGKRRAGRRGGSDRKLWAIRERRHIRKGVCEG
mmetsp:Transcript_15961/g.45902  ORF Transcript_15961/g.45902 Transcript_15961/m.45902 type:complete len:234 (-) Transcript_15961:470-1171(-)